jgi:hypothetical protein
MGGWVGGWRQGVRTGGGEDGAAVAGQPAWLSEHSTLGVAAVSMAQLAVEVVS